MNNSDQVGSKKLSHICYLCRLSARFLLLTFLIGCLFSVLGKSTSDFIEWRVNLSRQVMERSYMPLIIISLYALGTQSFFSNSSNTAKYWKRLIVISSIFILLYSTLLINSAMMLKSQLGQSFIPQTSKKEAIELIEKKVIAINNDDDAINILKNVHSRLEKSYNPDDSLSLDNKKELILNLEKKYLDKMYGDSKAKFANQLRSKRVESAKYFVLSALYVLFYSFLLAFFNRLAKYTN